ncbi:MAG: hypothetical protein GF416_02480 [Candidatus Altiarchaeales archaeon]|nr:hypothetical protein [Candidatus Altiarchaeales archaeon]MBD3415986.1 hypothetical protein [Candidatus Altiarchaeales archaeon]
MAKSTSGSRTRNLPHVDVDYSADPAALEAARKLMEDRLLVAEVAGRYQRADRGMDAMMGDLESMTLLAMPGGYKSAALFSSRSVLGAGTNTPVHRMNPVDMAGPNPDNPNETDAEREARIASLKGVGALYHYSRGMETLLRRVGKAEAKDAHVVQVGGQQLSLMDDPQLDDIAGELVSLLHTATVDMSAVKPGVIGFDPNRRWDRSQIKKVFSTQITEETDKLLKKPEYRDRLSAASAIVDEEKRKEAEAGVKSEAEAEVIARFESEYGTPRISRGMTSHDPHRIRGILHRRSARSSWSGKPFDQMPLVDALVTWRALHESGQSLPGTGELDGVLAGPNNQNFFDAALTHHARSFHFLDRDGHPANLQQVEDQLREQGVVFNSIFWDTLAWISRDEAIRNHMIYLIVKKRMGDRVWGIQSLNHGLAHPSKVKNALGRYHDAHGQTIAEIRRRRPGAVSSADVAGQSWQEMVHGGYGDAISDSYGRNIAMGWHKGGDDKLLQKGWVLGAGNAWWKFEMCMRMCTEFHMPFRNMVGQRLSLENMTEYDREIAEALWNRMNNNVTRDVSGRIVGHRRYGFWVGARQFEDSDAKDHTIENVPSHEGATFDYVKRTWWGGVDPDTDEVVLIRGYGLTVGDVWHAREMGSYFRHSQRQVILNTVNRALNTIDPTRDQYTEVCQVTDADLAKTIPDMGGSNVSELVVQASRAVVSGRGDDVSKRVAEETRLSEEELRIGIREERIERDVLAAANAVRRRGGKREARHLDQIDLEDVDEGVIAASQYRALMEEEIDRIRGERSCSRTEALEHHIAARAARKQKKGKATADQVRELKEDEGLDHGTLDERMDRLAYLELADSLGRKRLRFDVKAGTLIYMHTFWRKAGIDAEFPDIDLQARTTYGDGLAPPTCLSIIHNEADTMSRTAEDSQFRIDVDTPYERAATPDEAAVMRAYSDSILHNMRGIITKIYKSTQWFKISSPQWADPMYAEPRAQSFSDLFLSLFKPVDDQGQPLMDAEDDDAGKALREKIAAATGESTPNEYLMMQTLLLLSKRAQARNMQLTSLAMTQRVPNFEQFANFDRAYIWDSLENSGPRGFALEDGQQWGVMRTIRLIGHLGPELRAIRKNLHGGMYSPIGRELYEGERCASGTYTDETGRQVTVTRDELIKKIQTMITTPGGEFEAVGRAMRDPQRLKDQHRRSIEQRKKSVGAIDLQECPDADYEMARQLFMFLEHVDASMDGVGGMVRLSNNLGFCDIGLGKGQTAELADMEKIVEAVTGGPDYKLQVRETPTSDLRLISAAQRSCNMGHVDPTRIPGEQAIVGTFQDDAVYVPGVDIEGGGWPNEWISLQGPLMMDPYTRPFMQNFVRNQSSHRDFRRMRAADNLSLVGVWDMLDANNIDPGHPAYAMLMTSVDSSTPDWAAVDSALAADPAAAPIQTAITALSAPGGAGLNPQNAMHVFRTHGIDASHPAYVAFVDSINATATAPDWNMMEHEISNVHGNGIISAARFLGVNEPENPTVQHSLGEWLKHYGQGVIDETTGWVLDHQRLQAQQRGDPGEAAYEDRANGLFESAKEEYIAARSELDGVTYQTREVHVSDDGNISTEPIPGTATTPRTLTTGENLEVITLERMALARAAQADTQSGASNGQLRALYNRSHDDLAAAWLISIGRDSSVAEQESRFWREPFYWYDQMYRYHTDRFQGADLHLGYAPAKAGMAAMHAQIDNISRVSGEDSRPIYIGAGVAGTAGTVVGLGAAGTSLVISGGFAGPALAVAGIGAVAAAGGFGIESAFDRRRMAEGWARAAVDTYSHYLPEQMERGYARLCELRRVKELGGQTLDNCGCRTIMGFLKQSPWTYRTDPGVAKSEESAMWLDHLTNTQVIHGSQFQLTPAMTSVFMELAHPDTYRARHYKREALHNAGIYVDADHTRLHIPVATAYPAGVPEAVSMLDTAETTANIQGGWWSYIAGPITAGLGSKYVRQVWDVAAVENREAAARRTPAYADIPGAFHHQLALMRPQGSKAHSEQLRTAARKLQDEFHGQGEPIVSSPVVREIQRAIMTAAIDEQHGQEPTGHPR